VETVLIGWQLLHYMHCVSVSQKTWLCIWW